MGLFAPEAYEAVSDVRRPGLPALFVFAMPLWGACAAVYFACRDLSAEICSVIAAIGLCGSLAGLIAVALTRKRYLFLLVSACFVGCACAGASAIELKSAAADLAGTRADALVRIDQDSSSSAYGSQALATVRTHNGATVRVIAWFDNDARLLSGECVEANVRFETVSDASAAYAWSNGIALQAKIGSYDNAAPYLPGFLIAARRTALEAFEQYGGPQAGILQALICGYRETVADSGEYLNYQVTGLAHIVAVSGSHLALVTSVLSWALLRLRARRAFVVVATSAFVLAYLVFTGVPLSAVRACAMVLLANASLLCGRRSASLSALSLCIVFIVALSPSTSLSVSLYLSAASTLGIILFAGLFSSWFDNAPRLARSVFVEPLSLTLSSCITTLPFSSALFSQLPIISPIANIVSAPLFSLSCVIGMAAACLSCIVLPLAPIAVSVAAVAVEPFRLCVGALASVPFASAPVSLPTVPMIVASTVLTAAVWIAWPRLRLRHLAAALSFALAVSCAVVVGANALAPDEIVMLDVGQGDAILIRSRGQTLLVDTGNQDSALRRELAEAGAFRLDGVVITHPDDDHCASLSALKGTVATAGVFVAADALDCPCDNCSSLRESAESIAPGKVIGLEAGDVLNIGNFRCEVLWPFEFQDEGGNADSLVMRVAHTDDKESDGSALLCGDAEYEQLEKLVSSYGLGKVDVLKVGHHGAKSALSDKAIEALSPSVALISCGANNRYGHPHAETLRRLESIGACVLRTDANKTIEVIFGGDALSVRCENK